mmetsp:Transcript_14871/g.22365  ORF Transcript_14871/g.22365 Transcript_14871/m.22365 type:complete len:458 (+) Transcript_14871:45-1418(+)
MTQTTFEDIPSTNTSIWVAVFCVIGSICIYIYVRQTSLSPVPLLPHIPSNSILFGFTKFGNESLVYRLMEDKGPIQQFISYGRRVILISDPHLARKALRDIHGKGIFHNPNPSVIETNTFNVETGQEWQKRRSSFRKAFSTLCLKNHISSVSSISASACDEIDKYCQSNQVLKIDVLFQRLTLEIICKVAFEMDLSKERCEYLHDALKSLFEERWVLFLPFSWYLLRLPFGPFQRRKRAGDVFNEFKCEILRHIRSLREAGTLPRNSLAESILAFSDLPGVTEKEVLGEIGVFFLAGMDTTAHTLAFAVYALAANREVQKRAQESVDKMHQLPSEESGGGSGVIIPPYVEAVLKESMRRYPTASSGSFRRVNMKEGYNLTDDIHLPYGWWVEVNIYAIHNSTAVWGADATEFKPERFLPQTSNETGKSSVEKEQDPLDSSESYEQSQGGKKRFKCYQ